MNIYVLAGRSAIKNLKMYYLYFFSMIISVSLFFVFSSLQYDETVAYMADSSVNFASSFQVAGILLIVITLLFTLYANNIFIRRRSQEIGLYQLIGLSKNWISRLLVIEHFALSSAALIIGLFVGILLSRLFVLLFVNIIGINSPISLTFSSRAFLQTLSVYLCLVIITSLQMYKIVYGSTLVELFHSQSNNDRHYEKNNIMSGITAVSGLILVASGYYISTLIIDHADNLLLFMLLVLISTVLGTYFIFKSAIGWLLSLYRKSKRGNLSLYNSLSIAPLMHKMKDHSRSLTLITILSAMTITMISLSYSLYYSTEKDVSASMPLDFVVENSESTAENVRQDLQTESIPFSHHTVSAIRLTGRIQDSSRPSGNGERSFLVFSEDTLKDTGSTEQAIEDGYAVQFNSFSAVTSVDTDSSREVSFDLSTGLDTLQINRLKPANLVNINIIGEQLLVNQRTFDQLMAAAESDNQVQVTSFDLFNVTDGYSADASPIFHENVPDNSFAVDYHSYYSDTLQANGVLIFISGFLGLVLLLATGSIMYFKQMSEAEQEKDNYRTLRQLGFQSEDIMIGIKRKQFFVYFIPLTIGLSHSFFALKVGSVIVNSSIVIPVAISMLTYTLIYAFFGILTVRYYSSKVNQSLERR
ncbi:bacitracin ABC transporter permease BceB [Alkalibacterium sp. s-m-22]